MEGQDIFIYRVYFESGASEGVKYWGGQSNKFLPKCLTNKKWNQCELFNSVINFTVTMTMNNFTFIIQIVQCSKVSPVSICSIMYQNLKIKLIARFNSYLQERSELINKMFWKIILKPWIKINIISVLIWILLAIIVLSFYKKTDFYLYKTNQELSHQYYKKTWCICHQFNKTLCWLKKMKKIDQLSWQLQGNDPSWCILS